MSTQTKTTFLMFSLMFSLSGLPGFTADAGSSLDLSSSAKYDDECDFDDAAVRDTGKTCRARLRTDSGTQANISARVVNVPKKRRLSDPVPTPGQAETEEMVEVNIEASSAIAGCTTGCSRSSTVTRRFPISDARNVAARALQEFEREAERLRLESKEVAAQQSRGDNCEVDSNNRLLQGRAKRECLLNRISQIQDPEEAARFYDEHIKNLIVEMIKSPNAQVRRDAEAMVKQLQQITARNPYLRESLKDIKDFGDYYTGMMNAINEYDRLPPNHPNRAQMSQQIQELYRRGASHFQQRGIKLDGELNSRLAGWNYTGTWSDDLSSYQQELENIYEQHRANIGGTGTNGSQYSNNGDFRTRQPGAPGTGRGSFNTRGNNGQTNPGRPTQPYLQGPNGGATTGRPTVNPPAAGRPGQAIPSPFGQPRVFGGKVR